MMLDPFAETLATEEKVILLQMQGQFVQSELHGYCFAETSPRPVSALVGKLLNENFDAARTDNVTKYRKVSIMVMHASKKG